MYIHNYQIHNVLNAYRKQLSQGSDTVDASKRSTQPSPKDMVSLSQQGQQPSIVNKISAEIIDRIAQFGPQSEFENVLADRLAAPAGDQRETTSQKTPEFTYTLIDEQNRRTTHSLPIQGLDTQMATESPLSPKMTKELQPVKELLNNQPEASQKWKG